MPFLTLSAETREEIRWRLPELWMLALGAAAWLALAVRAQVHSHAPDAAANWRHWMLMVAAMMLPLQIDKIRLVAERSLWSRRYRAALGYVAGYLGVWAALGAPLAWAFTRFHVAHRLDWRLGAAIGFLATAIWWLTPLKRVAATMCHRTVPLSDTGWEADRDCLFYGCVAGCSCAWNCWPLMLVCWLSSHSFIAMIFGFALGWADRHFPASYGKYAALVALLALAFAGAGAMSG